MNKNSLPKDPIYSEEAFQIIMDHEILRAIRYPSPISLIYLEMTPHTSDEKTPESASSIFETTINSYLRSVDIPVHYGTGYLILLPSTNEAGARAVCKRLLTIFEKEFKTEEGKTVKFSLKIGVASHEGGPTLMKETLIKTAETNFL
ncbi:MAG: hypothetical protein IPP66_15305 [Anaerolineales bacterium]|nr:hypothetical protein [Anaerolineales bacterium]